MNGRAAARACGRDERRRRWHTDSVMRAYLAALVCCAAACTGVAEKKLSTLRDLNGDPLPAYAFALAEGPVFKVRCPDGNSYLIVPNPPEGRQFRTVIQVAPRDLSTICDKIMHRFY